MRSTHCGCSGTIPLQHLPSQHLSGWHREQWAPQKAAWLLTAFLHWTFSTTTSVTLKLLVTCVWVRSYLIHSWQGRELTLFPSRGKRKAHVSVRSMLSACWQWHVLLPLCKHFSPERVLRNAFVHSCRTWEVHRCSQGSSKFRFTGHFSRSIISS